MAVSSRSAKWHGNLPPVTAKATDDEIHLADEMKYA